MFSMPGHQPTLRLVLILLLLSLSACKEKGEASSPVLVRVDGRSVTLEQFQKSFEKTLSPDRQLTAEEKSDLQRSFLVQVVDRELALAEAARLGVAVTAQEVEAALLEHRRDYPGDTFEQMLREEGITLEDWRRELEEGLLLEKVIEQAVNAGVAASEAEIAAYYEEHQAEFDRPAQVRARQIVVAGKEEGEKLLARLKQGEPFAEVAGRHSLSPDAEQGGDLGFFARGEMPPEFDAVVFTLPVGRLSGLVKSEYGYHIFLVEERREAVRLPLAAAREEIRNRLLAEKEEKAYQQWLQDLRGKATIEVDWSLL
jgi:peptidyl-prolyl cis-trans isomerase C